LSANPTAPPEVVKQALLSMCQQSVRNSPQETPNNALFLSPTILTDRLPMFDLPARPIAMQQQQPIVVDENKQ
jgi:hypothetical protein